MTEAETLGVTPCASAARASKTSLARDTIASAEVIFERVLELQLATELDLAASRRVLELLSPAILEPEFYDWYSGAIALIRSGELTSLPKHLRRLAAVSTLPLVRTGLLDRDSGEPLEVELADRMLILSERETATVPICHTDGGVQLHAQGKTITANSRDGQTVELDWVALDNSGKFSIADSPIGFRQSGFALKRAAEGFERQLASAYEIRERFRPIEPSEFEQSGLYLEYARRFGGGFNLIRRCWPELFEEICVLTDHICLIRGNPFIGGTGIECLGVIFLNLELSWPELCFPDHIVHEAAHQRLRVEFEVAPALSNENFLGAASPIRRDPRPLHGILHGTFVFLRLAQFFERVLGVQPSLNAEQRFHRHVRGLYDGMQELERHARWTARGGRLFEAMCEVTRRLKSTLPEPDPRLYTQAGPDYTCGA